MKRTISLSEECLEFWYIIIMENSAIYAISLAAVFLCFFLWRLLSGTPFEAYHHFMVFLCENMTYRLIFNRPNGSADITPLGGISLFGYISGNVVACAIGVTNVLQLTQRLGVLVTINLVPLYSGGPTGVVERSVLGLSLNNSRLAHHWIGRVCAVQALTHGLLHASTAAWAFSSPQIVVGRSIFKTHSSSLT